MSATDPERLTEPDRRPDDPDAALRPKSLREFIGQEAARENLRVFIESARSRQEAMDHVLFFAPPPASARRRWRRSWRRSSGSASAPPAGR